MEQKLLRQKVNHERRGLGLPRADVLFENRVVAFAACHGEEVVQEQQGIIQLQDPDPRLNAIKGRRHGWGLIGGRLVREAGRCTSNIFWPTRSPAYLP